MPYSEAQNELDGIGSYVVSEPPSENKMANRQSHQASTGMKMFNMNAIACMTPSEN